MSPTLLNLYTERIFKQIELPGLNINGKIINIIRYADDTVLLAESEQELQGLVEQVNRHSAECGLDININNENYDN